MSEIPKNPQYIGQADASTLRKETPVKSEFTVSPEQRITAEAIHNGADIATKKIEEAKIEAGKKLQGLHGRELVVAGLKKIGIGLGVGWASETIGSLLLQKPGKRVGLLGGAQVDVMYERFMENNLPAEDLDELQVFLRDELPRFREAVLEEEFSNFAQLGSVVGEQMGKDTGKFLGTEVSGGIYGMLTRKSALPKLRWYDWALGQVGALLPELTTIHIKRFELNLVNPTTVSGLLNVAKGITEMVKQPSV